MTINIQIDAEHLEKLAYIGQKTHRDPNALLSQAIDCHFVSILGDKEIEYFNLDRFL